MLATAVRDFKDPAVRLHAIVDHSIVAAVYNNRTAMEVYARPDAASDTGARRFGTPRADVEMWELDSAG